MSEKLVSRISDSELERRWALTRKAMQRAGVDVLVMQNSNEFVGGYVKWFTDIPARQGVPISVIFPLDSEMIVVRAGPRGGNLQDNGRMDWPWRGVNKVLTAPYTTAECTTNINDAKLAAAELAGMGARKIGWVGMGAIRHSFGAHLSGQLEDADFIDFSNEVDEIKAIKSAEEITLIRQTAHLQDQVFADVVGFIEPGMREFEVAAFAYYQTQRLGSTQGFVLTGSAPMGTPATKGLRHFQNRRIEDGDQFTILIETNGPGGFYTEIGRTIVLGKASQEMLSEFDLAHRAQRATLDRLKPGADPAALWDAHNAYMRDANRPEERRLYAHGQGYDLVERPSLRDDDPMKIAEHMSIVVHPTFQTDTTYAWVCDNYMVEANGVSDCLHKTEKKVFQL
uniref:M24 family metallopeptidase n=1 Tax=Pararhizobium sp. IMCC3301 TaxID=3067904 RepID=UPI0027414853|nr:M24 family metallopeptidase [Pararhizobium sp. IMCC3301]